MRNKKGTWPAEIVHISGLESALREKDEIVRTNNSKGGHDG